MKFLIKIDFAITLSCQLRMVSDVHLVIGGATGFALWLHRIFKPTSLSDADSPPSSHQIDQSSPPKADLQFDEHEVNRSSSMSTKAEHWLPQSESFDAVLAARVFNMRQSIAVSQNQASSDFSCTTAVQSKISTEPLIAIGTYGKELLCFAPRPLLPSANSPASSTQVDMMIDQPNFHSDDEETSEAHADAPSFTFDLVFQYSFSQPVYVRSFKYVFTMLIL
jgi:hypothetical protein